mgnify:CR=1 FL=1
MKYLFRGGTVVSGRGTRRADVLVEDEKILLVARSITAPEAAVIDVEGQLLLPGFIDAHLHLLAYDILHAAYQRGYYPKGFSRNATAKERAKAVKEKQTRAELCLQIAEKEQELQELQAAPVALPDLTGCRIVHKMFGAGTVLPGEGQFMVIDFNGTLKKFSYTASMNSGYLSAEDPNVEARLQAYQDYNKDKDRLEKELKNLKAELVKL